MAAMVVMEGGVAIAGMVVAAGMPARSQLHSRLTLRLAYHTTHSSASGGAPGAGGNGEMAVLPVKEAQGDPPEAFSAVPVIRVTTANPEFRDPQDNRHQRGATGYSQRDTSDLGEKTQELTAKIACASLTGRVPHGALRARVRRVNSWECERYVERDAGFGACDVGRFALTRTPVLGPRFPPAPTGIPEEIGLEGANS